jgi:hypothetical protein
MQLRPPLSPGMARQRLAHRLTEMHERIFADKVETLEDSVHVGPFGPLAPAAPTALAGWGGLAPVSTHLGLHTHHEGSDNP